ncbi:MAG: ornithine cyclodeaminase family protein [Firmicutes bacterium]|nr:ornithine cyclodeaminase family protein [Bacillota bacterium]
MKPAEVLFLSQEDVIASGALDMGLAIPTMEEVFRLHHARDYVLPPKCVLRWGGHESEISRGRINAMPGWIGGGIAAVGIKWIASSPTNPFKHRLPRASAVIALNDPETLVPIAIMDGTVISASRTGANTGVAAKYLAKPGSRALGLIGAGVQNRTQLLALKHVLCSLRDIRVYDVDPARAWAFAREMGPGIEEEIRVVQSAGEAVAGADVWVTATVTHEPVIKADWLEPGVFYSHVGSHECEFAAITRFDKRVVDDWGEIKHRGVESLAIMYHDGVIGDDAIHAELGQIVSGEKPGRESPGETIYFNTVGMGIEDIALADAVYKRALQMGLGQKLRLWEKPFAL